METTIIWLYRFRVYGAEGMEKKMETTIMEDVAPMGSPERL